MHPKQTNKQDSEFSEAEPSSVQAVPSISIVSTMYWSRPYLETFIAECIQAIHQCGFLTFEIVLVNDGSPDDSLDYALSRRRDVPELVVIDLSRNFGHHRAILAGLREARGDLVFLSDCDLEVSPSVLGELCAKRVAAQADFVFGYQTARKGNWFERWSGSLFWSGFNWMSDTKVQENILTESVMTRRFVNALLTLGDYNMFLGGMLSWTGFRQVGVPIIKTQRIGQSTYTILRRIQLMVNAVSSFSTTPLVLLFKAGLFITVMSFSYVVYLIMRKVLYDDTLVGYTSMMALMAMSLGIMTTGLGVIGIYLGKVFDQVRNRPPYIVRDIYR